jgi:hypothetical protein
MAGFPRRTVNPNPPPSAGNHFRWNAMQASLFAVSPNPKDVVYTPDNVAFDMVTFFQPTGKILEPSKGDGALLKYLPGADWCEIESGRDFFNVSNRYDWIVGNPPYSIFADWLRHSFKLADNVVYLIPIIRCWVSSRIIKDIRAFGGIKTIAVYDEQNFKDWSINFAIGAVHFQRGYKAGQHVSLRGVPTLPAPDKGDSPAPRILSTLEGDSTAEHEPTPAPCG